jgi:purine-binding chemotaxis protein CheW
VPQTPNYVEGIVNLRGDIIPVINVRKRFLKPSKPFDEQTCIVFVEYHGYQLGLIVDNVKEVMFIEEEFIVPPPSAKLSYYNQFIKNIGKVGDKVILLLDLDRFLLQE